MSDDEHNAKVRQIGECVAAMVMLKEQICGMYAGLEEKRRGQAEQITALVDAERRLRKLVGELPNDPLTLASIVQAAERVESSTGELPAIVKTAIDEVGEKAASGLTKAAAVPIGQIEKAAQAATAAANDYRQAARRAG